MKYNDWAAVSVMRGKKDVWAYTTFTNGLSHHQFLKAEKAADVLVGLRATDWKEEHRIEENKEVWIFKP